MNHVVEGILGAFSPYYVPAALDIYFLEEFKDLPQALKTARPTIFFSVPRFYEKVRAAVDLLVPPVLRLELHLEECQFLFIRPGNGRELLPACGGVNPGQERGVARLDSPQADTLKRVSWVVRSHIVFQAEASGW
jgi:hypothetical protein